MKNKKLLKGLEEKIELPKNVDDRLEKSILILKGPKGDVKRDLNDKRVKLEKKDNFLMLNAGKFTKTKKKIIKSYAAHIKNMIRGSLDGHNYVLKICSGHFPMNVAVVNNELVVKNFLGEKIPRKLMIKEGSTVKVEGDKIVVQSTNKEIAGQVSADIEQLMRRTGYDRRILQDAIYLVNKDGKELH